MIKIDDFEVEDHYVEYAAELVPGTALECDNEQDAREHAERLGGKVLVRHVYETAWAELEIKEAT